MPERGGEGVVHIVSDRPDQFTDLAIAMIIHLIFLRSRPLIWRQDRPSPHPQASLEAYVRCSDDGVSATILQPIGFRVGWNHFAGGEYPYLNGVHARTFIQQRR